MVKNDAESLRDAENRVLGSRLHALPPGGYGPSSGTMMRERILLEIVILIAMDMESSMLLPRVHHLQV
ncbi:hypothetical protein SAY86_005934 [Trapa natans]|uniref:Uncharacterized protein n=1 Tax=Trapa natans TaxID=22666 RepID=A0AAN7L9W3_TRANT|nr:hypothetical protein SAY86_005934 [Trapa natans]